MSKTNHTSSLSPSSSSTLSETANTALSEKNMAEKYIGKLSSFSGETWWSFYFFYFSVLHILHRIVLGTNYYFSNIETHHSGIITTPMDEEAGSSTRSKKKKKRRMDNRNGCLRCLCCACCLPKWATYIVWFIIISIIIVVIVLGAIMSKFVLPTIEVGSVTNSTGNNDSPMSFNGDKLQLNFGLTINAKNPNLLPIYVSDMDATVSSPSSRKKKKIITFHRHPITSEILLGILSRPIRHG